MMSKIILNESEGNSVGGISKLGRKGIRGDLKGNRYERAIAKRFTKWATSVGLKNPDGSLVIFAKTPGSGGRPKQSALPQNANMVLSGDIICPDWWPFAFECKDVQSWSLDDLLYRPDKCLMRKAWDIQAIPAAEMTGRRPLLVFHKRHHKDLVMIEMSLLLKLSLPAHGLFVYWGITDTVILFLDTFLSSLPTTIAKLKALVKEV